MAKLTKLQRSQNSHFRLRQKAADIPGKKGEILFTYHNKILQRQKAKGQVLSRTERKLEFDSIKSHFNPISKTYAQISNEYLKYGRGK